MQRLFLAIALLLAGALFIVITDNKESDFKDARIAFLTNKIAALEEEAVNREVDALLEPAVDDLKVTSSSVLSVPREWSRLYQTAWEYIEAKDGIEGSQEFVDAVEDNIVLGAHKGDLAAITAAIRYQEDGGPGREYGALSAYAKGKTYRKQAGECAFSVQANWDRYLKGGPCLNQINGGDCTATHLPGDSRDIYTFIAYQGHVYCPVGAENDNGDNKYWIDSVTWFYNEILRLSK